jgi:hypothetical protein
LIHYALVCAEGHEFESWFRDSGSFDSQSQKGLIACPFCQITQVAKALMTPHVSRGVTPATEPDLADPHDAQLRQMVSELHATIAAVTEDVGEKFPEEARRIHDGEARERPIRGRASLQEAKALVEEGIQILPIPGAPTEGN